MSKGPRLLGQRMNTQAGWDGTRGVGLLGVGVKVSSRFRVGISSRVKIRVMVKVKVEVKVGSRFRVG